MHENRNYLIISYSEVPKLNFGLICETSEETLRISVNGQKTLIKWEGYPPEFISSLENTEGPYSHSEIISIMNTPEWNPELSQ
jgi:hypothetical protein